MNKEYFARVLCETASHAHWQDKPRPCPYHIKRANAIIDKISRDTLYKLFTKENND